MRRMKSEQERMWACIEEQVDGFDTHSRNHY